MPRKSGRFATSDVLCPAGHRLLVQLVEARTEAEARAALVRTFGREKGSAAVLVAGSRRPVGRGDTGEWVWSPRGWRAYLPVG